MLPKDSFTRKRDSKSQTVQSTYIENSPSIRVGWSFTEIHIIRVGWFREALINSATSS